MCQSVDAFSGLMVFIRKKDKIFIFTISKEPIFRKIYNFPITKRSCPSMTKSLSLMQTSTI
jgi:hypothetical protein